MLTQDRVVLFGGKTFGAFSDGGHVKMTGFFVYEANSFSGSCHEGSSWLVFFNEFECFFDAQFVDGAQCIGGELHADIALSDWVPDALDVRVGLKAVFGFVISVRHAITNLC